MHACIGPPLFTQLCLCVCDLPIEKEREVGMRGRGGGQGVQQSLMHTLLTL